MNQYTITDRPLFQKYFNAINKAIIILLQDHPMSRDFYPVLYLLLTYFSMKKVVTKKLIEEWDISVGHDREFF